MAADNKHLGRFMLDGIAPAPRGVPQIEVTFDIDANGILNVSAKDKGTGKEQKITITGSTGLSDDEIDRMAKEAEIHAEEDKKKKEAIEARNNADSTIYQGEKLLKDNGDKVSEEDKSRFEEGKKSLEDSLKKDDPDEIKEGIEKLQKILEEIGTKIYQQASQEQGAQNPQPEDVVDADFTAEDKDK